jgi:hypothetical protein
VVLRGSGGVPSRIDDDGFWWRGAMEARLRVREQGGGTIWRHGGVDGKPSERLRFGLASQRWFAEREVGVTSRA